MEASFICCSSLREHDYNTEYKKLVLFDNLETLKEAVIYDHIAPHMKDNKRGQDNFDYCKCIMMDLDNTHSEDPDTWRTLDDIQDAFPDVGFYYVHSRNYMKVKTKVNQETGEITQQEPREKFHLYFPLRQTIADRNTCRNLMLKIAALFPYFDLGAAKPEQFFYGVENPTGGTVEGELTIDEFINTVSDDILIKEVNSYCDRIKSGEFTASKEAEKAVSQLCGLLKIDNPLKPDKAPAKKKKKGFIEELGEDLDWLRHADQENSLDWFNRWADDHGIQRGKMRRATVGNHEDALIIPVPCPGSADHKSEGGKTSSVVIIDLDGTLNYVCKHDHCKVKGWSDYRSRYDPPEEREKAKQDKQPAKGPEDKDGTVNLKYFHYYNTNGTCSVFDVRILNYLIRKGEIKILGTTPYIYEKGVYSPDKNGAKLKTMIKRLLYPECIRSSTIKRIYELFLYEGSIQMTSEDLNNYPKHWINFQNGFYDPIEKKMIPHSSEYLAVNQIPYCFDPDAETEGPNIDSWLDFITPDPDDREMLLQYCGYCMTTDTRQQKFLILYGTGGSGKSTLINLLENIVGAKNISHVSLKKLTERFQNYPLLFKLVNSCADLEVEALKDPSTIKQLLGEDSVQVEPKGRNAIEFKLYAKQIFSANQMPTILNERSNGFYRRLMILTMNKTPAHADHDFFNKLKAETPHFIRLCVDALGRLYESGSITESRSSKEAVRMAWAKSDTVQAFLDDCCETENKKDKEGRQVLYSWYQMYCLFSGRMSLNKPAFYEAMRIKNFPDTKINGSWYFKGIDFKVSLLAEIVRESNPEEAELMLQHPFDYFKHKNKPKIE